MASIEQAAANLAAALESGNALDAESALASYAEAIGDDEPLEADLEQSKVSLDERFVAPPAELDLIAEAQAADEAEAEADATAAAEALAEAENVDLSKVEGSGAGGRIVVADVKDAAAGDES